MCNFIVLYKQLANYPIVALHSRYEKRSRLETPPRILDYPYKIYAPYDVPSRGGWVGINEHRLCVGVTNQYSTVSREKTRSRGLLLLDILGYSKTSEEALEYLEKELPNGYTTANIVILDSEQAYHVIYDKQTIVNQLEEGIHVITPLTSLPDKKMNEKLRTIKERATKRKKRSLELLSTMPSLTNVNDVISHLKYISRDHGGKPSPSSICYHNPSQKMEQKSATILATHKNQISKSKIIYCPGNPCKQTYIDYSHIFKEKEVAGGELWQKSTKLQGKKIALCVTGSVASILAPKAARTLRRHGAEVKSYMSKASIENGVPLNVMEWATGNKPIIKLTGRCEHLEDFDSVVIYPATYNTISKIAQGTADNPVTTLTGAIKKDKIVIAPAMNLDLWTSPILQENIKTLQRKGATFVNPHYNEGIAKVAQPNQVVSYVIRKTQRNKLQGRNILLLTGPTRSDIDPVRYIGNKSTGKLGHQLALESFHRGCNTTVIYGPGEASMPPMINVVPVYTPEDMKEKTMDELRHNHYDIIIFSAAVLDYIPSQKNTEKLRSGQSISLPLTPTSKIIKDVQAQYPKLFTVGFKLGYQVKNQELIDKGYAKLQEYNADLVVANDLAEIHGDFHPAFIVDKDKNVKHFKGEKRELAETLFSAIEDHI